MKKLITALALCAACGTANATLLTFDDATLPADVSIGGRMTWNGTGGGHYYDENYYETSSFFFATPTTVNSFDLNGLPWEGYWQSDDIGDYLVQAFDSVGALLWTDNIDLSGYGVGTWGTWLTVSIDIANVSELRFGAAGPAAWPAIDNLVINEVAGPAPTPVSEPATLALLALGVAGVAARRRKAK